MEIWLKGNCLDDLGDNYSAMKQGVSNSQNLMENTIRQVSSFFWGKRTMTLSLSRGRWIELSTDDQVEMMHENLRDGAKLVFPEKMIDIETAWELVENWWRRQSHAAYKIQASQHGLCA